jgi:nitroreductase
LPVLDTIKQRGSIRKYADKSIANSDLLRIVEAARLAQSAANRQPWQFIIVTDKATKERLMAEAHRADRPPVGHVGSAAAVIVCLGDPKTSRPVGPFEGYLVDLSIAIENMALASWDMGIGSCWIGAFDEDKVKSIMGVPGELRVVSLLTLGYPDEAPKPKDRKTLEEIVYYEKYGQKRV